MITPIIHTDIIGTSSFLNGINHPFNSTDLNSKNKLLEGSHKAENDRVVSFKPLFSKYPFLRLCYLFFA